MSTETRPPNAETPAEMDPTEDDIDLMKWRFRVAQGRTRFTVATKELAHAMAEMLATRLEVVPTGDSAMSVDFGVHVQVYLTAADMAAIKARRRLPPPPTPPAGKDAAGVP